jgi:hypothetical protein
LHPLCERKIFNPGGDFMVANGAAMIVVIAAVCIDRCGRMPSEEFGIPLPDRVPPVDQLRASGRVDDLRIRGEELRQARRIVSVESLRAPLEKFPTEVRLAGEDGRTGSGMRVRSARGEESGTALRSIDSFFSSSRQLAKVASTRRLAAAKRSALPLLPRSASAFDVR